MTGEDTSLNNAHLSLLVISHLTRARKALRSSGPGALAGDAASLSHPTGFQALQNTPSDVLL